MSIAEDQNMSIASVLQSWGVDKDTGVTVRSLDDGEAIIRAVGHGGLFCGILVRPQQGMTAAQSAYIAMQEFMDKYEGPAIFPNRLRNMPFSAVSL